MAATPHLLGRIAGMFENAHVGLLKPDGQEVRAPSYKRQPVKMNAQIDGSDIELSNANHVSMPMAKEDWGPAPHTAIFDGPSGDNRLLELRGKKVGLIEEGGQRHYPPGALRYSIKHES